MRIIYLIIPAYLILTTVCCRNDFTKLVHNDPHSLSSLESSGKWCHCWNNTETEDIEVECRCHGLKLTTLPKKLPENVEKLTVSEAGITVLEKNSFQRYRSRLQDITLSNVQHLHVIEDGTFRKIENLRSLYISDAPLLKSLSLLFYGITSKKFLSLRIMHTGLQDIPDMSFLHESTILHMVDLEDNKLNYIPSNSIRVKAEQVLLSYNQISYVEDSAFNGSQIAKLKLKGNRRLTSMHSNAFANMLSLQELDLSGTSIQNIPAKGLEEMEVLRLQDTPSLKTIPSLYDFKSLKEAWLTHSFHCCAFQFPVKHDPEKHAIYIAKMHEYCRKFSSSDNSQHTIMKRNIQKLVKSYLRDDAINEIDSGKLDDFAWGMQFDQPLNATAVDSIRGESVGKVEDNIIAEQNIENEDFGIFHDTSVDVPDEKINFLCGNISQRSRNIICYPKPDALNPCEDIMGSDWLRVSVWFVVITAVIGNLAVIVVFFSNLFDVNVPKFLMFNLAFADICMGLYLFLIASMDLHSMGYYFNFAYHWQIGDGCQVAGFLTVFSSQLSVFTLTIITLERWFAIRYAIYLNRRIRLGAASKIMAFGWLYSIIMASLPLFGISNYSSTSICLPMEAKETIDMAYLISLLLTNGLAFLIIVICYTQIYFSLGTDTRRSTANNEMTIAKKMALLVFTDFACWAPIAFFGLTALAGYPLINVTRSKILLVFFYPLNSCANPYLYAILTAQYRRDFFALLYRWGICKSHVRRYTMSNNTMQTTNQSNPMPLLIRSTNMNQSKKAKKLVDEALV